MNRFFVKPDDMTEDSAAIIGEDVKHLSFWIKNRVLPSRSSA